MYFIEAWFSSPPLVQNISAPLQGQLKVALFATIISNLSQGEHFHNSVVKNGISQLISRGNVLWTKKFFVAFGHFFSLKALYIAQVVERSRFKCHPHAAKGPSYPELSRVVNQYRQLIFLYGLRLINKIYFSKRRRKKGLLPDKIKLHTSSCVSLLCPHTIDRAQICSVAAIWWWSSFVRVYHLVTGSIAQLVSIFDWKRLSQKDNMKHIIRESHCQGSIFTCCQFFRLLSWLE